MVNIIAGNFLFPSCIFFFPVQAGIFLFRPMHPGHALTFRCFEVKTGGFIPFDLNTLSLNQTYIGTMFRLLHTLLLTACCAFFSAESFCQLSSCPNADFEQNSFANWTGTTGWCCPITSTTPGIVAGRHTIMTAPGTDPYSLGQIEFVPAGFGNYTARLGNDNIGAEAEQLIYSFVVSPATELFIYRYAVVLEDPAHDPTEQPRFEIRVYDSNGNLTPCGYYAVVSSANIPGFQNNGTYRFKTWTTVGIELSAYMGQTVTIEFSTGDCALGGHFGYAYLECYCSPLQINSDFCPGSNIATINAPVGFQSYLWSTGQTTSSITVTTPVVGTTYSVTMTSVTGCSVTLSTTLTPTDLIPDFYSTNTCRNGTQFMDSSYVLNGSPISAWQWNFGDGGTSSLENPVHVYSAAGNYNVTLIAQNGGGCTDTIIKNITIDPIPTADFNSTTVCPGVPVSFTDNSSFPPGTITAWQWNFGDGGTSNLQNPNHTYSLPGTFNVTLIATASNGCTDTIVQAVSTVPAPVANFGSTIPCGSMPVSFSDSTTIAGGTIALWSWNFGDGSTSSLQNPVHTYATGGVYNVTLIVQSNTGCVDTIVKPVSFSVAPVPAFVFSNACEGNFMQFTDQSTLSGGSITSWQWNFGNGGTSSLQHPQHVYASAGNYNVTLIVTGSNGCNDTLVQPVNVNPSPVAAFNATSVCPNVQATFTDNSSYPSGTIVSWNWYFGDGTPSSTLQNPVHVYTSAGTFNVTLVVTGNTGCYDSLIQVVSTLPAPNADFTAGTACAGNPVSFTDLSSVTGGSITSWSWDFGDGSPASSLQNPIHVYANSGSWFVNLIVQTLNGCSDTIQHEVTINPLPVPDFNAASQCVYDTVFFNDLSTTPSGNIIFWYWFFGNGASSSVQFPSYLYSAGGYYNVTLIVEATNGCIDSVTETVNVRPQPVAGFNTDTVCEGIATSFTDLSSTSSGTVTGFTWDFGDGSPASNAQHPSHTYSSAGTYLATLVISNSPGCIDTISKNVIVKPRPAAGFYVNNVCTGIPAVFFDTSLLAGFTMTAWQWSFGDGGTSGSGNPAHAYAASGNYNVTLSVTASNGCAQTVTHGITIYPLPVAAFSQDTLCEGTQTSFYDGSSVSGGSISLWNWNFGDGNTSSQQNPVHAYASAGVYTVTLVAFSSLGCRDTVTLPVSVYNLPSVDFIFTDECFNHANSFTDLSFVSPGYISNWIWNFGDSTSASGMPNTNHLYALPGTYNVQLTAVSSYGCRDSVTKQVEVWELPVADFTPDPASGCKPLPVQFNDASTSNDGFISQWQWNFGDSAFSSEQNPHHIYLNDGIYSVWLMVTTSYGCIDTINYFNLIEVYPKPVAGFDFDPAHPSILHPMVYFYDQSYGANAWFYDFGDTVYSNQQNPIHAYENQGTYLITQIVTNQYLCTDTATKLIEVLNDYTFWIPNTFTPNGDGKNDYFTGIGINVIKYELAIFNRWGDMIFESASMSNPWDGKVNGSHVQEGTYIFKIAYTDVFNQPHELLGHVNVVR